MYFCEKTFQSPHSIRDSISFQHYFFDTYSTKQTHIAFSFEVGKMLNNKTPPKLNIHCPQCIKYKE